MAVLHSDDGVVVVRLVFDGLPRSGKTTSIRALAGSLSRPVTSPGELDGRTLFFDWMDYTGGRFEGMEIRCQVVSVPGQASLLGRRLHLLDGADAVVFVADTRGEAVEVSLDEAVRVRKRLQAGKGGPPVGLVLQANKRDAEDAVPIRDLRELVHSRLPDVGIVESCATEGLGVRETFVFAVRLALDRVRELLRTGRLENGPPDVADAAALFRQMEGGSVETEAVSTEPGWSGPIPAATALAEVLGSHRPAAGPGEGRKGASASPGGSARVAPKLPDETVPSGLVWPPVEGRVYLHEASAELALASLSESGDWVTPAGASWLAHSPAGCHYHDLEKGRKALIEWARSHVAATPVASRERCVVLSPTGWGTHRLWQLVRRGRSVGDQLEAGLRDPSPDRVAEALLDCARLLASAAEQFRRLGGHVEPDLENVGLDGGNPVYLGLMPFPPSPERAPKPYRAFDLLSRHLGPSVRSSLDERPKDVARIIDRVLARPVPSDLRDGLAMVLLGERPGSA